jgi:hypothetical protein
MSSEAMHNSKMSNDPVNELNLCRLHDTSKYTVAEDDPDVRGWEVVGSDGAKIGRVDDLIIDPQAKKVRYLDVEVDNNFISQQQGKYLLIPIGMADLHEKDDQIVVHNISAGTLANHSFHSGGPITREYEESVRTSMAGSSINADPKGFGSIGNSFYNQSSFDEDKFHSAFRARRGQRGFKSGLPDNLNAFNSGNES